jgi:hypothetical protein
MKKRQKNIHGNHHLTDKEVLMVLADAPTESNALKYAKKLGCEPCVIERLYSIAINIAARTLLDVDPYDVWGPLLNRYRAELRDDPYIARIEKAMQKMGWLDKDIFSNIFLQGD